MCTDGKIKDVWLLHIVTRMRSLAACALTHAPLPTSRQQKPAQSALSPLKLTLMQAAIFYLTHAASKCALCAQG